MAVGDLKFSAGWSFSAYMDTDLNSLANGAVNVGAVIIDNTTNMHRHFKAELVLASLDLATYANGSVDLYLVPIGSSTSYSDTGTDASTTVMPPGTYSAGRFGFMNTNAAQLGTIEMQFYLTPGKYTPVVVNKLGVALAASGNTLKIATTSDNVAQS